MRNLIIFLLFFNVMSSQNLVTREIFGNRNPKGWNTFIGGISSTISTSAQLATKLGISNNRIRNFVVVGSDIKCRITRSYAIPFSAFQFNHTPCTYYRDTDYLVTSIGANAFYATSAFSGTIADFKNCVTVGKSGFAPHGSNGAYSYWLDNVITIGNSALEGNEYAMEIVYIPRCTSLGDTAGNNEVFASRSGYIFQKQVIIYTHPSLATNNAGAPDGDLTYAISQGATVRYVTNFTPPNPITSLATGTITSTSIQFNFTNPTGSTNAYDFSEIYKKDINGNWLYISEIASGGIVSGLTTGTTYNFKIVARDIFYNGAESFITASTL